MLQASQSHVSTSKTFDRTATDLDDLDTEEYLIQSNSSIYFQSQPKLLSSKLSSSASMKSIQSIASKPHLFVSRPVPTLPEKKASPGAFLDGHFFPERVPNNVAAAYGDGFDQDSLCPSQMRKKYLSVQNNETLNERQKSCPVLDPLSAGCKADGPGVGLTPKMFSKTAQQSPVTPPEKRKYSTIETMMGQTLKAPVTFEYSVYKRLSKEDVQSRASASPRPILCKSPAKSLKKICPKSPSCLKRVKFAPNLLMLVYDRDASIGTS